MTAREAQITVTGVDVRYWDAGTGDPVVILDGGDVSWSQLQDTLSETYRVVRLALAHSGSAASAAERAELAANACVALGIGTYTLIADDVTAGVAMRLILRSPGHADALVLLSPLAIGPAPDIPGRRHDAELEARLSDITCPTLVVFGSKDPMVGPEAARIYAELMPDCHVSFVYDAGHDIMANRPEALIGLVRDYVERREAFVVGRASGVVIP